MNKQSKTLIARLLLLLSILISPVRMWAQEKPAPQKPTIAYGQNPAAGGFVSVNGINLYVETYGKSTPLLLIHGNGGSIADMKNQIEFFAPHYQRTVSAFLEQPFTRPDTKDLFK